MLSFWLTQGIIAYVMVRRLLSYFCMCIWQAICLVICSTYFHVLTPEKFTFVFSSFVQIKLCFFWFISFKSNLPSTLHILIPDTSYQLCRKFCIVFKVYTKFHICENSSTYKQNNLSFCFVTKRERGSLKRKYISNKYFRFNKTIHKVARKRTYKTAYFWNVLPASST